MEDEKRYSIEDLKGIMRALRSENGCPWDKEQTHKSIRNNLIEETYEAVEAIDCEDSEMLREELGDLLLQIVFHSHMEDEISNFDFDDVVNDICAKLIERHPHVSFDDVLSRPKIEKASSGSKKVKPCKTTNEVLENWDKIKNKSKGMKTATQTLRAVPKQLPALMRTQKIQGRVKKANYDYIDCDKVLDEIKKSVEQIEVAMRKNIDAQTSVGKLLFDTTNISRLLGYEAEEMLYKSCGEFVEQFEKVEQSVIEQNLDVKEMTKEQLEKEWNRA